MKPLAAYAGIGSRETPEVYREDISWIAGRLVLLKYLLRSGHADRADLWFEKACDLFEGKKQIFLPWQGFNGAPVDKKEFISLPYSHEANRIASNYHPHWDRLSPVSRLLIVRNGYQIYGQELNDVVKFVVCYTKHGLPIGGTGQALRIANALNVPVFNLGSYDDKHDSFPIERRLTEFQEWLKPIHAEVIASRQTKV